MAVFFHLSIINGSFIDKLNVMFYFYLHKVDHNKSDSAFLFIGHDHRFERIFYFYGHDRGSLIFEPLLFAPPNLKTCLEQLKKVFITFAFLLLLGFLIALLSVISFTLYRLYFLTPKKTKRKQKSKPKK